MIQKADNQDLEFVVEPLVIDGAPINPAATSWRLEMWTLCSHKLIIESDRGNAVSTGEIRATCIPSDTDIRVYAKGSVTPYGKGNMQARFTIFAENPNFEDGRQVIRTLDIKTGIQIV